MNNIYLKKQITEYVHPKDMTSDINAIQSIIDGKRDVGFIEVTINNVRILEKHNIGIIVASDKFKRIWQSSVFNKSFPKYHVMGIIYRRTPEAHNKAMRLYKITILHDGYLSDKTPDEAREIGQILGYYEDDINDYISKKYGKKPPLRIDTADDYDDLHESKEIKNLNKKILYTYDDVKVVLVNGEKVRDDGFIEWVEGGHYYVDCDENESDRLYSKYIPEDEIWIDDIFESKPNDLTAIILHERIERYLMKFHGISYNVAHDKYANPYELEFRKKSKGGKDIQLSNKIFKKCISHFESDNKKKKLNEDYHFNISQKLTQI